MRRLSSRILKRVSPSGQLISRKLTGETSPSGVIFKWETRIAAGNCKQFTPFVSIRLIQL
jgi:hypothetical protein